MGHGWYIWRCTSLYSSAAPHEPPVVHEILCYTGGSNGDLSTIHMKIFNYLATSGTRNFIYLQLLPAFVNAI